MMNFSGPTAQSHLGWLKQFAMVPKMETQNIRTNGKSVYIIQRREETRVARLLIAFKAKKAPSAPLQSLIKCGGCITSKNSFIPGDCLGMLMIIVEKQLTNFYYVILF